MSTAIRESSVSYATCVFTSKIILDIFSLMPYHYIAERHGLRSSLATTKGPTCQQGDISEDSENTIPVLELDKLPEV